TLGFRIGAAVGEAEDRFQALEPDQYRALDFIVHMPRVLIRGGAGTGKTILAMEEAVRSSRLGKRTLLVCFNKPLALYMERKLAKVENLTVSGFHALCGKMARQAGIILPQGLDERQLYGNALPNALCQAMEADPRQKW